MENVKKMSLIITFNFQLTDSLGNINTVGVECTDVAGAWLALAQFYPTIDSITQIKLLNPLKPL